MLQTGAAGMRRLIMIITQNWRIFYREVLNNEDKKNLVCNIVEAMSGIRGPKKGRPQSPALSFSPCGYGYGMTAAQGLGIDAEKRMPKQHNNRSVTV
jgi:hypothetical protein